jgi:branched-chain amino acid transport system substrate-binding protein
MNKKVIIGIVLAVLVGFAIYYFLNKKEIVLKENNPIKIGVMLPLTGDAASYGKSLKSGLELTKNESVKYIFEDTKADPKTAVNIMNKFISLDKVDAVIGDMFTHTTMAINPIASSNNILLLTPTASSSKLTETGKTTFRIYPSEKEEANILANFFNDKFQNNKAAIFVVNEDAMVEVSKIIENSTTNKFSVVEKYSKDILDFKPILSKLDKDLQTIFILGYMKESVLLIKQAKELNIKVNFFGLSTLYNPQFGNLIKGVDNNIFLTAPYFSTDSNDSIVKTFISKYYNVNEKEPDVWAGYGYDAGLIINEINSKAKQNKTTLVEEMYKIENFNGVTGNVTINSDRSISKIIM